MRDDRGLVAVCEREYPRLVGLIALHVGERAVAEELAQEALLRLCRRWTEVADPPAWLTRVSLNLARSTLRRRGAERRALHRVGPSGAADVSRGGALDAGEVDAIRRAVSRLPERQRTAVVLRFYEGMSVAETADMMRCAEGTVKAHTHRGVQRLGDLLGRALAPAGDGPDPRNDQVEPEQPGARS